MTEGTDYLNDTDESVYEASWDAWDTQGAGDAAEDALLPAYLRPVDEGRARTCGTLSYLRKSRQWVIRGEPSVTEMAKRLFPGAKGKRGEARFPDSRRTAADLKWFMLRFPLDIRMSDLTVWQEALGKARERALRDARADALPRDMVPPEGTFEGTLMPFQKEGLSFLVGHDRTLLADEMGLGKTVQALAALASTHAFPCLIIPPAHLCLNWQSEARRFLRLRGAPPRVHILTGLRPYPLPEADVYILHYLLLRGWKDVLPDLPFQAVVFDEMQELRHGGTEKYSAASLLSSRVPRVIGLSGTPIYNRGAEIWNVINILDFHFLGDREAFSREWCTGYGSETVAKPDILGDYLRREGLMFRRTKQQVLSELPPKRRLVQELDWNDRVYVTLMEPVLRDLGRWREGGDLTPQSRTLLENSISLRARQATGIAKAPFVCAFVRALLDSGEKVLLFAHHHDVFDIYRRELASYSPGFITGREDGAQKENAVRAFTEGGIPLLCISLRAGSGLNLQSATCVVFGELDWSPAVHAQAEDRAHRIGQKDSLLCYYLVSPSGSDAFMQEALGLKVSQFVSLMGDTPRTQQQVMEDAGLARRHVEALARALADKAAAP